MVFLRRIAIRKKVDINIKIRDLRRSTRFWLTVQALTMAAIVLLCVDYFGMGRQGDRTRQVRKLTHWEYSPLGENSKEAKSLRGKKPQPNFNLYHLQNDRPEKMPEADHLMILSDSLSVNHDSSYGQENSEKLPRWRRGYMNEDQRFHKDNSIRRQNGGRTQIDNTSVFSGQESMKKMHDRSDIMVEGKEMKKFLFFGMRPRWTKFCRSHREYYQLVSFPRVISCPKLHYSVLLNFSETPADIASQDVVLFTNVFEWLTSDLWDWAHGNRTADQRWVMVTQESPFYVPGVRPLPRYGNATYHWIDSYSGATDFHHPYGWFRYFRVIREWNVNVTNFMSRKTHLMAWMASHCETLQWDRQGFVRDLMGYLSIDTYGKCGGREIRWNRERLYTAMLTKYKFYLSLENSCCGEYVTEKFWRSLKLGIVPVVVGAPLEDYLRLAPPNSFLHVDMFDSMADMVAHIRELDSDDNRYIEYLRWRTMGQLTSRPSVDQFLLPLSDRTQCSILNRYVRSSSQEDHMIDYYNSDWHNSCSSCGKKAWVGKYMYDTNHTRLNEDIWA